MNSSIDSEATRLEVLHQYQILDTVPEAIYDELTQLAAQICQTPVALITFVDANRQWFKSMVGSQTTEAPLNVGFCPFVIQSGSSLIIPDTLADEKFSSNPIVASYPHVRSYAGIPLVTSNGYLLGTLCVLDFIPRQLSQEQINALQTLSRQVMTQLELQFTARQLVQRDTALVEVMQGVSASIGEAFFYSLVQHFAKALGVDFVYIGLLAGSNQEAIKTIAACAEGQIAGNFEYLLRGTPCQSVIQQRKICCYPRGVQALFPHAPLLAPLAVESYVAVPFFDSSGTPLGLLGVMDRKPLKNVQLAESLLTIFATRVATELERQQAEAERNQLLIKEQEARQEAEAANRLKDEFLAVLSHELRSPLNPILGWAQLLQTQRQDEAKTKLALKTIERNAKLQAQLIDDLLDVSRILLGKLSLKTAPVDLSSTIEAALETVRLAAQAKSIDLRFTLLDFGCENTSKQEPARTDELPNELKSKTQKPKFIVLGESSRLQQVVWNLLSNAVKFTPPGGRVEIHLSKVISNESLVIGDGDPQLPMTLYAQITVVDTGKGINPDFLPYVFDYFRQADSTTTRKFGGLGLGLAIVRHLVELHGGIVQAASPGENQGATFTVRLPLLLESSEQEAGERSTPCLTLPQMRILVVDDDTDTREFLAFLLEQQGVAAIAVSSADEALKALAQAKPDLLISDIGMPEVDGYMLLRQIRSLTPEQGGQIPAIALTAYAGELDKQQAIAVGFQTHIIKPVDPIDLIQTIANLTLTAIK